MPKKAVSVTLEESNVLWLRGRTVALKRRSLSDVLDEIVHAARTGAKAPSAATSVVGTIDIASSDPLLEQADQEVRALFDRSVSRPVAVDDGRRPTAKTTRRG